MAEGIRGVPNTELENLEDWEEEDEEVETPPKPVVVKTEKPVDPEVEPQESEKERHEKIAGLISDMQTGEWRKAEESKRLDERYGTGYLGKLRAWLGGEHDYSYDAETGSVKHNVLSEVGRRVANVAWKTAKTAAIIAGIGLLTGGTGAVPAGAILGSALGRGFCEAWKGFGDEGSFREKLILAQAKHYKEAEELASGIGPENPEGLTGEKLEQYQEARADKIKSLVKFIYSSEKKVAGAGNLAGVASTEKELDDYLKKMKTREEWLAFGGGLAGGVFSLLHAKGQVMQHLQTRLDHGEKMAMDLDHDGVWHYVQTIDSGVKSAQHISSNYVFNYNGTELAAAHAHHASVLAQGPFGSHVLNDSVTPGLSRIANGELFIQSMSALLGLAGDNALARRAGERQDEELEKRRKQFSGQRSEILGQLAPETKLDRIKAKAEELKKTLPEPGDIWSHTTVSKGKGANRESSERHIKIISVDYTDEETPLVSFSPEVEERADGKEGKAKVETMALETFIAENTKLITAVSKKIELTNQPAEESTEVVEEKPATNVASSVDQSELVSQLEQAENLPEEKIELFRNAAFWVLSRATNEQRNSLNVNNPTERDERFKALAREVLKNEFVVHFANKGFDDKNRFPDLDGRCALGLLALAGVNNQKAPRPVAAGEFIRGKINLWTGVFAGGIDSAEKWEYSDDTTGFADMHGQNVDQEQSATKTIHEVMVGLDLLEDKPYIQKIVEFATDCDNLTYPNTLEDYKKSDRTLYGLSRFMSFENVEKFFQAGKDPSEQLSNEELKEYGLLHTRRKKDPAVERKEFIEASLKNIQRLEKEGWALESNSAGKILVNVMGGSGVENRMNAESAYAMGFNVYLIWNPSGKSFFVSRRDAFPEDFSLDEGVATRENMWIKTQGGEPLKMNLRQLLERVAGPDFAATGELEKYLESEKASGTDEPAPSEDLPLAA
ncbi:MAG: hypothetical protein WCP91_02455 [Candidatus Berkelbacteria bacterium]